MEKVQLGYIVVLLFYRFFNFLIFFGFYVLALVF